MLDNNKSQSRRDFSEIDISMTVRELAFINNEISKTNLEFAISHLCLNPKNFDIVILRNIDLDASLLKEANVIDLAKSSNTHAFIDFLRSPLKYRNALEKIKVLAPNYRRAFIVNNDNLLCNFVINQTAIEIFILGEGLMNYQDITLSNRSTFIVSLKKLFASIMRTSFVTPAGHLSGSYEKRVSGIFAFASKGLKAPNEKFIDSSNAFLDADQSSHLDPRKILITLSGVHRYIKTDSYIKILNQIRSYLEDQNPKQILVKPHPRISNDPFFKILKDLNFKIIDNPIPAEKLIPTINTGKVISIDSTALVTIKLRFPKISCIDFGFQIYSVEHTASKNNNQIFSSLGIQSNQAQ